MRIDALHLKAVGPFTDRRLDFSAGEEGLHVVLGANEAGKSSMLRALRALLFGFHPQTADNFLHSYAELRVGATLRAACGESFTCYRRKGLKNTLLDEAGAPMDEQRLLRLMQGVDERRFDVQFGIDHAQLVAGGQALVEEHGREAEVLLGTGLGSAAVHQVRKALEDEAASLFLRGGSKPEMNRLLLELAEARSAQREASLAVSRFDELRREAARARKALEALEADLGVARVRRTELERLRRTLPGLARRAELYGGLAAQGESPALAEDFARRRAEAVERRRAAGESISHATRHLDALEAQIAAATPDERLLDERDAVDALVRELSEQRRAARERPALAARREHIAADLAAMGAVPGVAGADAAALSSRAARQRRAEELASQKAALEGALQEAERQLAERRAALQVCEDHRADLAESPDTTTLAEAVRRARDAGDLDAAIARQRAVLAQRERAAAEDLAALGRFTGDAAALLALPLPDEVAVAGFTLRFDAIAEEERRGREAVAQAAQRDAAAAERLRALAEGGEVPSADAVAEARCRRDVGWALLRARWVDGRDDGEAAAWSGEASLPDAYEAAVTLADSLVDALVRDAERVHARDALLAERESAAESRRRGEAAARRVAEERAAVEGRWCALWQSVGLAPGSAREMEAWLRRARALRERLREVDVLRADHDADVAARRGLAAALARALPGESVGADGELATLRARAEQHLESCRELARRRAAMDAERESLGESVRALGRRRDEARAALDAWREAWSVLTSELELAPGASPGELRDHLASLQRAAELRREHAELGERLGAMDEAQRRFEAERAALCARVAPELAAEDGARAVDELHARLRRQLELATRLATLREQADGHLRARESALAEQTHAEALLEELCGEAGGVPVEALEAVEQRASKLRSLRRELEDIERRLTAEGDGATPQELARAAEGVNADAVRAELESLVQREAEELEPRRRVLLEAAVHAERAFDELTGGEAAAGHAERVEQLLAGIRSRAERYLRVRLAAKVLGEQMARVRAEHRDPVLAAASVHLATLTAGEHVAVDTVIDEADEAVLCAVAGDGERRRVEALSTGTRDQLYLALRLAWLERWLANAEPLPLVVDDVLVHFDDARARATLAALADFARRTQVLLFTHHERIARDAEAMAPCGAGVFVHRL
jgi:uncharacterized protein YhaN